MVIIKSKILVTLLCSAFVFTSCNTYKSNSKTVILSNEASSNENNSKSEGYNKITAEQAKEMMDNENVIIVDVRTIEEYKEEHIEAAISMPNEEINEEKPENLPDLDSTILVYCRTGRRSKEASEKLVNIGYKNIYDFGGITDWPYETVKGEE